MIDQRIQARLNEAYERYARSDFVKDDPILIPAQFSDPRDIEISALLTATLAWGQRTTIINNASKLMQWMDHHPYQFITQHQSSDLKEFSSFVHRTFNFDDLVFFMTALQRLYAKFGTLEAVFSDAEQPNLKVKNRIELFRTRMLGIEHLARSEKHISSPARNSSAKRLNI